MESPLRPVILCPQGSGRIDLPRRGLKPPPAFGRRITAEDSPEVSPYPPGERARGADDEGGTPDRFLRVHVHKARISVRSLRIPRFAQALYASTVAGGSSAASRKFLIVPTNLLVTPFLPPREKFLSVHSFVEDAFDKGIE